MIYAIIDMNNEVQRTTTIKSVAENWIDEGYTVSILEVARFAETPGDL